ncbi:MAG: HAD family phosphatase [Clostridiales bacterium]|nr:HAD family phosphatase [Clostridiales bacterium]
MTGYLFRQSLWKIGMKNEKRILFLDMDGTALNDVHQLSRENIEALKCAIEAGHEVVVTTGRPAANAEKLLRTYGLDRIGCRYVIAFNGGTVLDCASGEVLFSKALSLDHMKGLVEEARKAGIYLQVYEGNGVLTEKDDENLAHYINKTGMPAKVVEDMRESLREESCKALAIDVHDHERLEQFRCHLADWAKDWANVFFSCAEYLEIVPKGICKGDALRAFCESQGVPVENSIAAGDESNDLSMIQAAGVGCAVANALELVKEEADYICQRDNNHSAIQEIVERFMS